MRIATWNVNGVRKRFAELQAWLARDLPDVVCLQEIKAAPEQITEALTGLPDYHSYWHGQPGGYSGVSIHLRKSVFPETPRFVVPAHDRETRIVEAHAGGLVFASLYMPNGGKDFDAKLAFFGAMRDYVKAARASGNGPLVLAGDMNIARDDRDVHPTHRKLDVIGQRPDERLLFESILEAGLLDVGRTLFPDADRLFTWWPYWRDSRKRNLGWRIDYVLADASLAPRILKHEVLVDVGTSDHAPLVVELAD